MLPLVVPLGHIRQNLAASSTQFSAFNAVAYALGKADLAALLRSPSAPVQLAVLRASNALSQHVETLPTASLPWIVRLLQGPDGMFAQQQSAKE